MIHKLFDKAAVLHGHKCPGLAIGVRAAAEAIRILKIQNIQDKNLYCVAESMACYIDGIQVLSGCTFGKGNLIYRPTGKTAFSFYIDGTDRCVRFLLKDIGFDGDRSAKIEYILTAPLQKIFEVGKPRRELLYSRREHSATVRCPVCGELTEEHMMLQKDGRAVCRDCAGED